MEKWLVGVKVFCYNYLEVLEMSDDKVNMKKQDIKALKMRKKKIPLIHNNYSSFQTYHVSQRSGSHNLYLFPLSCLKNQKVKSTFKKWSTDEVSNQDISNTLV